MRSEGKEHKRMVYEKRKNVEKYLKIPPVEFLGQSRKS
jgi:hypothetical protein